MLPLALLLLVAHLAELLLCCLAFLVDFGVPLAQLDDVLLALLLLVLLVDLAYLRQTLYHGVDLLLLLVHEHLLEGSLGGQLQGLQEIVLPA